MLRRYFLAMSKAAVYKYLIRQIEVCWLLVSLSQSKFLLTQRGYYPQRWAFRRFFILSWFGREAFKQNRLSVHSDMCTVNLTSVFV